MNLLHNPEFRRHLWLELSPQRLLMMPSLVLLCWLLSHDLEASAQVGLFGFAFFAFSGLWGSHLVAQSLTEELQQKTWDSQRTNGLSASELLIGKLLGAPIYAWYGALCCTLPLTYSLLHTQQPLSWLGWLGLGALMFQALSLLLVLVTRSTKRNTLMLLVGLLWVGGGFGRLGWTHVEQEPAVVWWGASVQVVPMIWASLLCFLAWSWVGCWRLMRRELQYRNQPWYWLGFVCFMVLYSGGFVEGSGKSYALFFVTCSMVSALVCYCFFLYEGFKPLDWQILHHQWQQDQYSRMWAQLPLWPLQALVTVLCWAVSTGLILAYRPDDLSSGGSPLALMLAALAFFVRDLALLGWSSLQKRRQGWGGLVYLLCLYTLLPAVTMASNEALSGLFFPIAAAESPAWVISPLLQALLVGGLWWRAWTQNRA